MADEMRIGDWSSDVCSSDLEGESCPDGYGLGCQGGGRGGAGELWAVHHACGCRAVSWYLEQHLRAGKALMGSTIYLDYQATTPLAPEVFAAMTPWLRDQFANPHSAHRLGRMAAAGIEWARGQVGRESTRLNSSHQ